MKSECVAQGLDDIGLRKRRNDFNFLAIRQEDEHAWSFAGIVGHQPADDLGTLVGLYVEKHELSRNSERLRTTALSISNRSPWRPRGPDVDAPLAFAVVFAVLFAAEIGAAVVTREKGPLCGFARARRARSGGPRRAGLPRH